MVHTLWSNILLLFCTLLPLTFTKEKERKNIMITRIAESYIVWRSDTGVLPRSTDLISVFPVLSGRRTSEDVAAVCISFIKTKSSCVCRRGRLRASSSACFNRRILSVNKVAAIPEPFFSIASNNWALKLARQLSWTFILTYSLLHLWMKSNKYSVIQEEWG